MVVRPMAHDAPVVELRLPRGKTALAIEAPALIEPQLAVDQTLGADRTACVVVGPSATLDARKDRARDGAGLEAPLTVIGPRIAERSLAA